MDCATCEALIDAYVDGELSAGEALDLERVLPGCDRCRRRLEDARTMRAAFASLPNVEAPAALRMAVRAALPSPRPDYRRSYEWRRWAAAILVAAVIGWLGGVYGPRPGTTNDDGALIAGYLRATMGDRPVEVASSDRHTVKPWFNGRVDYAPPVHDLTSAGFPLVGGRLEIIDGRRVAVLVFQRSRHLIVLYTWPEPGERAVEARTRDGFTLARWTHGGFALSAVSDVAAADLLALSQAFDQRSDAER
jgi:anti-sigma factor RsiW